MLDGIGTHVPKQRFGLRNSETTVLGHTVELISEKSIRFETTS